MLADPPAVTPCPLTMIVPSRGRPESAAELCHAFVETCSTNIKLLFAVDEDDPRKDEYKIAGSYPLKYSPTFAERLEVNVIYTPASNMVEAVNAAAMNLVCPELWSPNPENFPVPFAVGFMGDDHRPRTVGWDLKYLVALRSLRTGFVYGDDKMQSERLPTQIAMTSNVVKALGYMAPPQLFHMFVDNFWLALGRSTGSIRYLPDVVVEHMHPVNGKSDWTEGHKRVNSAEVFRRDEETFRAYLRNDFDADVRKVQGLIND